MSAVEVFQFPATGQQIRTVLLGGEPWFVGRDACDLLALSDLQSSLRQLDDDEKGRHSVPTPGGYQQMTVINESGLYSLILRSRRPEAKAFKRWVTHEVLPAIRRTGQYEVAPAQRLPQSYADALRELASTVERAEAAEGQVLELAPRAAQADAHRAADGLLAIDDFANRLKAWAKAEHQVVVKHREVWDFLADIGLIIRGNTVRHNQPTAMATDRDFVRTKVTKYETANHGERASSSSRLTPAGEGWAWDRAVRRIADHGSLKPSRELSRT